MSAIDKLFEKCTKDRTENVIKASDVLQCARSSFAFYCDCFVTESKKDPYNQLTEKLAQMGVNHEEQIIVDKKKSVYKELGITHEDQVSKKDIESIPVNFKIEKSPTMRDDFLICLDKMINQKSKIIYDVPLFYMPLGILGRPDRLERRKGKSVLGSYHYIVKEVKLARNIKYHHILQATFYNFMIGNIQGYTPEKFYLINGYKKEESYKFEDYKEELENILKEIKDIQNKYLKPKPILNNVPYPWSTYGNKIAVKNHGITLINGIKDKRQHKLEEMGLNTVNKIATCKAAKLAKVKSIGNKNAIKFIMQAKSLKSKKVIKKTHIILPEKKTEIFLDFEGDPITDWIYLIGILIRKDNKEKYIPFVSYTKKGEKQMWINFLNFLKKQNDYIIYHYHNYEKRHIQRMITKYKSNKKLSNLILDDNILVDLYKIATESFVFPTYGNGLKDIATWIGFKWKDPDITGSNVGWLFEEFTHNPKSKYYLQLVLDYNSDDCKATRVLKDWLIQQK